MVKINRKVEYALMVLKHIHDKKHTELTSAREVCDQFGIPFDTTSKVMQLLGSSGILASLKGVRGGYTLNCDLFALNFLSLIELVEEKKLGVDCQHGNCELSHSCNITGPMQKLNFYTLDFFKSISVGELLTSSLPTTLVTNVCPPMEKVLL